MIKFYVLVDAVIGFPTAVGNCVYGALYFLNAIAVLFKLSKPVELLVLNFTPVATRAKNFCLYYPNLN